jgi:hypothetical protein
VAQAESAKTNRVVSSLPASVFAAHCTIALSVIGVTAK